MQVEMFDDDARLRDGAIAILQHRELTAGPQRLERRRFARIHQIDDVLLERRVVFIKRDQRLMAERRQRMEVKGERHALALGFGETRDRYASTIILKPPKIMRLGSNGGVPLHHLGDARVFHHLRHHLVAMRARLVDDPGEHDRLALLELHAARERGALAVRNVVGDAFIELQRAMLEPDLRGLLRHAAVCGELLLLHRKDKSIDVVHCDLPAQALAFAR